MVEQRELVTEEGMWESREPVHCVILLLGGRGKRIENSHASLSSVALIYRRRVKEHLKNEIQGRSEGISVMNKGAHVSFEWVEFQCNLLLELDIEIEKGMAMKTV